MPSANTPRSVALVGASGTVGKHILVALVAKGIHKITILTRPESPATFPEDTSITVHAVNYASEVDVLPLLTGVDVLVAVVNTSAYAVQTPLFRAAAKAGVQYIVPCEFGQDPNGKMREHLDMITQKDQYRNLIEDLGVSSWIGVVCGPWIEFALPPGFFGIDAKNKTASLLGTKEKGYGMLQANAVTLKRTGELLAGLLSLDEEELAKYKNKWVYFTSLAVSQRELLHSILKATGDQEKDWTIREWNLEDLLAAADKMMEAPETMLLGKMMLLQLIFAEDMGGNFNDQVIDAARLGLKQENLHDIVRSLVA